MCVEEVDLAAQKMRNCPICEVQTELLLWDGWLNTPANRGDVRIGGRMWSADVNGGVCDDIGSRKRKVLFVMRSDLEVWRTRCATWRFKMYIHRCSAYLRL